MTMTSRERVLNLITGQPIDVVPASTGFGNVIVAGLEKYHLNFAHVHLDAREMTDAAAATVELTGLDNAIVPFDMGVLAEALGATLNTYPHSEDILYPTLRDKFVHEAGDVTVSPDLVQAGRVPLVCEAIRLLKQRFGTEAAVGSWSLGPFTLAGQLMDLNELLKMTAKQPGKVDDILQKLTEAVILEIGAYVAAGADFISVREMGATSSVLSPRMFKRQIKRFSEQVIAAVSVPSVYHICGDTNMIITDMAEVGADAVSVDQKNDLRASREKLGPEVVLLGNIHPYEEITKGTPDGITAAVRKAAEAGADSVWPGCDIWPQTPVENVRAWVDAVHEMLPRRKA